jgi:hypothetical protein
MFTPVICLFIGVFLVVFSISGAYRPIPQTDPFYV